MIEETPRRYLEGREVPEWGTAGSAQEDTA